MSKTIKSFEVPEGTKIVQVMEYGNRLMLVTDTSLWFFDDVSDAMARIRFTWLEDDQDNGAVV